MENKKSLISSTLTSGVIFGIILILYSLIIYIFNINLFGGGKMMINFLVTLVIIIACLVVFGKKAREEVYGGVATYGNMLVIGMLITLFAAIVAAIYNILLNTVIDPDYQEAMFNKGIDFTREMMEKRNVPEDTIEQAIDRAMEKGIPSVIKSTIQSLISTFIFGFIVSLITSGILKKDEVKLDMEKAISEEK